MHVHSSQSRPIDLRPAQEGCGRCTGTRRSIAAGAGNSEGCQRGARRVGGEDCPMSLIVNTHCHEPSLASLPQTAATCMVAPAGSRGAHQWRADSLHGCGWSFMEGGWGWGWGWNGRLSCVQPQAGLPSGWAQETLREPIADSLKSLGRETCWRAQVEGRRQRLQPARAGISGAASTPQKQSAGDCLVCPGCTLPGGHVLSPNGGQQVFPSQAEP